MERTGSGWLLFSSIVLVIAGVMRLLDGVWALRHKAHLSPALQDGLLGEKLRNYGLLWLVVGALLVFAGLVIHRRSEIGRWIGIAAGCVAAVTAALWLPYYPIWSLVYVGIGVAVVAALVVHGGDEMLV